MPFHFYCAAIHMIYYLIFSCINILLSWSFSALILGNPQSEFYVFQIPDMLKQTSSTSLKSGEKPFDSMFLSIFVIPCIYSDNSGLS